MINICTWCVNSGWFKLSATTHMRRTVIFVSTAQILLHRAFINILTICSIPVVWHLKWCLLVHLVSECLSCTLGHWFTNCHMTTITCLACNYVRHCKWLLPTLYHYRIINFIFFLFASEGEKQALDIRKNMFMILCFLCFLNDLWEYVLGKYLGMVCFIPDVSPFVEHLWVVWDLCPLTYLGSSHTLSVKKWSICIGNVNLQGLFETLVIDTLDSAPIALIPDEPTLVHGDANSICGIPSDKGIGTTTNWGTHCVTHAWFEGSSCFLWLFEGFVWTYFKFFQFSFELDKKISGKMKK